MKPSCYTALEADQIRQTISTLLRCRQPGIPYHITMPQFYIAGMPVVDTPNLKSLNWEEVKIFSVEDGTVMRA